MISPISGDQPRNLRRTSALPCGQFAASSGAPVVDRVTLGHSGMTEGRKRQPGDESARARFSSAMQLGPHHGVDAVGPDEDIGLKLPPVGQAQHHAIGGVLEVHRPGSGFYSHIPTGGQQSGVKVTAGQRD